MWLRSKHAGELNTGKKAVATVKEPSEGGGKGPIYLSGAVSSVRTFSVVILSYVWTCEWTSHPHQRGTAGFVQSPSNRRDGPGQQVGRPGGCDEASGQAGHLVQHRNNLRSR